MTEVPTPDTLDTLDRLAEARNVLLTTFKRDGTPVATPVWHVVQDGTVYASTLENTGKVKRIRNNPLVTLAACTVRGTPTGPPVGARAHLLDEQESARIVKAVDRRYRMGRFFHVAERLWHRKHFVGIAIELTPSVERPSGTVGR